MNDLINFEWKFKSSEGFELAEEMADAGGLSLTNGTAAGLRLAQLRGHFDDNAATAPLAGQNNTTLWAWDAEKWRAYLENVLGPFVRQPGPPVWIAIAPTRG
jgi:hypothetical protein